MRQLNRQMTRHEEWENIPEQTRTNLQKEWESVLKAQGFGARWDHWILGFDCIPFVPVLLPSISMLHVMAHVTKHDTDLAIKQEERNRRHAHKHLIQQDKRDKNVALTFKALRDPEQKIIAGVPCPVQSMARLLRLSKGAIRLLLHDDTVFALGEASFGEAKILIQKQDRRFLDIQLVNGHLVTKAVVKQMQYTQNIVKLAEPFSIFGHPCGSEIPSMKQPTPNRGARHSKNS